MNRAESRSSGLAVATHVAALSVEIRTPLAQAELAASQLYREASTPNGRALVECIFEAVSDIDGLVERMLRVLVPRTIQCEEVSDLAPVVARLHRRFSPALEACGVRWLGYGSARDVTIGDPERIRSLCTELLHLTLLLCGTGGHFTLTSKQLPEAVQQVDQEFDRLDKVECCGDLEITLFCCRPDRWPEGRDVLIEFATSDARARVLEAGGTFRSASSLRMTVVRLQIPIRSGISQPTTPVCNSIAKTGLPGKSPWQEF